MTFEWQMKLYAMRHSSLSYEAGSTRWPILNAPATSGMEATEPNYVVLSMDVSMLVFLPQ